MTNSYSFASLTAREISLAAGCGLPHEDLAPLKHMITDLSKENSGCSEAEELSGCNFDGVFQIKVKPNVYKMF